MRRVRIALGLVGLVLAVYGVAGLRRSWNDRPPRWSPVHRTPIVVEPHPLNPDWDRFVTAEREEPRSSRWIPGAAIAMGLALLAFAAWPRGSKPATGPRSSG